jgi:hypothetical protein
MIDGGGNGLLLLSPPTQLLAKWVILVVFVFGSGLVAFGGQMTVFLFSFSLSCSFPLKGKSAVNNHALIYVGNFVFRIGQEMYG